MANKALVLERDGSILSFYTLRKSFISIFQNILCILFFALIPSFAAASMIVLQEIWHFVFGLLELPPDVTHLPTLRIRRGAAQTPRAACLKASRVCRDAAVPLYIAGLTLLKLLSADSTRCFGDAQQQWRSLCLRGTFSVDDAVAVVLPRSHLIPEVAAAREPWFYADDATLPLADMAQDDVLDGEWCPWCGCACQTTLGHFHTHMQSDCQDSDATCDLARASLLAGQAARWPHSPGPAVLRNCMQRAPSPHHICERNAFCQNLLHVIYNYYASVFLLMFLFHRCPRLTSQMLNCFCILTIYVIPAPCAHLPLKRNFARGLNLASASSSCTRLGCIMLDTFIFFVIFALTSSVTSRTCYRQRPCGHGLDRFLVLCLRILSGCHGMFCKPLRHRCLTTFSHLTLTSTLKIDGYCTSTQPRKKTPTRLPARAALPFPYSSAPRATPA